MNMKMNKKVLSMILLTGFLIAFIGQQGLCKKVIMSTD
jgi:hypothetical protein